MERQQQQNQVGMNGNEAAGLGVNGGNGNGKNTSSNYMCSNSNRQSSTRWTPTTEQIRILKELYYNNGIRSPTADQIQRISARLRQFGKIEGKNVFYWFQNHKARERQKKRFTTAGTTTNIDIHYSHSHSPTTTTTSRSAPTPTSNPHQYIYNHKNHLYPPPPPGIPSSSSPAGIVGVCGGNYGSLAMEKSFRDCSISQGGERERESGQNCGWIGVDPFCPTSCQQHSFVDQKRRKPFHHETLEDQEEEEEVEDHHVEEAPEIETLPLFPMHADSISNSNSNHACFFNNNSSYTHSSSNAYYTASWTPASQASLELSLNSYTGWSSMDLHN